MIPAVPLPPGSRVRTPIELKLKPKWRFDTRHRVFVSDKGKEFAPLGELPKNTRIVYKVPSLAEADEARLSKAEKDLRRYMQVILPPSESPAGYVDLVRTWPCVEESHVGPDISLPSRISGVRS